MIWAAVHQSMSCRVGAGSFSAVSALKIFVKWRFRICRKFDFADRMLLLSVADLHPGASRAESLYFAFRKKNLGFIRDPIEGEFPRRRAAVQGQYDRSCLHGYESFEIRSDVCAGRFLSTCSYSEATFYSDIV